MPCFFEDYVKDLESKYCEEDQWGIIPQGKKKGADFSLISAQFESLLRQKAHYYS